MASEHYFTRQPSAPSQPRTVEIKLPDLSLELLSDRGVFAASELDQGTDFLLRKAPAPPARATILDLGCGYGAIAVALAKRHPDASIWAVDINERALDLTKRNAKSAGTPNVHATQPETIPGDIRFDVIYSNPPIRAGKAQLHEMLTHWLDRLSATGHAYLVVHHHLGSDSLLDWLNQQGYATERLRSRHGYRILAIAARAQTRSA